ncbi:MAG TPA: hypothetical protein VFD02_01330 [Syntrophomonadaceae bacterium]|nr:hypothetical protein [Syntrophomonadaceae bacterium]
MSDDKNPKITLTAPPEIKVNVVGSGARGMPGKSAYQIWLEEGNSGSKEDFLESLKGEDGYTPIKGVDYFDGYTPVKNVDYFDGEKGDTPSITHLEDATMQAINNINTTNNLIFEQEEQRIVAEQLRQKNRIVVSKTAPTDSVVWVDTNE